MRGKRLKGKRRGGGPATGAAWSLDRRKNQRYPRKPAHRSIAAPTSGVMMNIKERPAAPAFSTVATAGFATPPVVAVETARAATVVDWTSPAVPPPARSAPAHCQEEARWESPGSM